MEELACGTLTTSWALGPQAELWDQACAGPISTPPYWLPASRSSPRVSYLPRDPGHDPGTPRATGSAPGRSGQPRALGPGTQPETAARGHRAWVLRQLWSRGRQHRLTATASQPPGIRTDRASVLRPLSPPEQTACSVPGSQDAARVFTAKPLNCAERMPPNCGNCPRASRLSSPRWQTEKAMVPRADLQGSWGPPGGGNLNS